MKHTNVAKSLASAGLLALLWVSNASAATVINVELWDKGANASMATDLAYPATGKDMSSATMGIKLSQPSAKTGVVTFHVNNTSKD